MYENGKMRLVETVLKRVIREIKNDERGEFD
jgi:hypothetical protein